MADNYREQSQSYKRGYVEGQSGERDVYLLQLGATDIAEYERGFEDGLKSVTPVSESE